MAWRACMAATALALCQGSADCCDRGPVLIAVDDFETCEEPLCGWRATRGEPERVPTFHAGEHGLRLEGGTRIEKDWTPDDAPQSVTELDLLVDCTRESRVVLVNPDGADANVDVGDRDDHERVLERRPVAVIDEPSTVILEARGDGSCLVDDVRLTSTRETRCQ